MKILIKQARIIDPSSPHNGQTFDIFIENGTISQIDKKISAKADRKLALMAFTYLQAGWMYLPILETPAMNSRKPWKAGQLRRQPVVIRM